MRENELSKAYSMKHKRHKKDGRDKSEKALRHDDHHYYRAEYSSKTVNQYTMKGLSDGSGGANEPKKLIIYIVIIHRLDCITSSFKNLTGNEKISRTFSKFSFPFCF